MGISRNRNSFQLDGEYTATESWTGISAGIFHLQDSHPVVQEDEKLNNQGITFSGSIGLLKITILLQAQCTNSTTGKQESSNTQDFTSQFETGQSDRICTKSNTNQSPCW